MDHLDRVRSQFGANAEGYATSPVHAAGASLERLVSAVDPQPSWEALDLATAAGHTAFAFAPHVARVVATDVTPEMVELAARGATERGLDNVVVEEANAQALPYDADRFDLVTCRIAPHHFDVPAAFVSEAARVLRSGGRLGLVDNVVPDDPIAADFANDFERRRDPSHAACLSLNAWLDLLDGAGFAIEHSELLAKRMDFDTWADRMGVPPALKEELRADLATAPPSAAAFLRPEIAPEGEPGTAFHLTECVVVASRRSG